MALASMTLETVPDTGVASHPVPDQAARQRIVRGAVLVVVDLLFVLNQRRKPRGFSTYAMEEFRRRARSL